MPSWNRQVANRPRPRISDGRAGIRSCCSRLKQRTQAMTPRCAVEFETLSAFADGQLEPGEELDIRRHLDGCEQCRSVVDSLIGLKEAAASTVEVHPVPHSLGHQ